MQGPALGVQFTPCIYSEMSVNGILYFEIQHESYSSPGLAIMLNFNTYKCKLKEAFLWV